MILYRNISLEYFDKLFLDGIKCFMVRLDAIQLMEFPENGL